MFTPNQARRINMGEGEVSFLLSSGGDCVLCSSSTYLRHSTGAEGGRRWRPIRSYQVCKWEVLRLNCVVSEMRLFSSAGWRCLSNLWGTNYGTRFIAPAKVDQAQAMFQRPSLSAWHSVQVHSVTLLAKKKILVHYNIVVT